MFNKTTRFIYKNYISFDQIKTNNIPLLTMVQVEVTKILCIFKNEYDILFKNLKNIIKKKYYSKLFSL